MRPSASSGPRDDVTPPRAENDQAEDEVPSGLKSRGRATSMIRRATPASRTAPEPVTKPPAQPEQDDAEPPSSGRVPAATAAPEPPAADASPAPAQTGETPQPADAARESEPAPPSVEPPAISVPPPTPSAAHRSLLADPTQRPPGAATSPSDAAPASIATPAKPLLASEALMEDLAPVEPARRDARIWCAACGVAFLLFGALPLIGLLPGGAALPWLVTGAISLIAGVARVAYRQRAIAMLVLGLLTGMVALQGSGTLVLADGGAGWGVARLFSAVALTAALLFRARYRAYAGARVFLGAALAISVPFMIHAVLALVADGGFGAAQVGALLVLVAIATTLIGFMGAETTGAGPYLAPVLVGAFAVELASRGVAVVGWSNGIPPILGVMVGASGFGAAAGFTALGLFQILAWRFAADARRIDLHSPLREPAPRSEHDPSREWSTRE